MSALFSPIRLRELALSNRIMVAPMCQYSAEGGKANDWHFTHMNTLALSGAAHAEGVKVTYAGKSPAVVRAEVERAARTVCVQSTGADVRGAYEDVDQCITDAVDAAYAQIHQRADTYAMIGGQPSRAH